MTKSRKIIITGGHLAPAQAVIAEFKKRRGWEIYYLGRKHSLEGAAVPSIESKIVPQMGVNFIPIPAGRLQRHLTSHLILNFVRLPLALFYSFYLLLKIRPDAILSFGGYVSVPPVIAGWILRTPIFTHEQTAVAGLANQINALFARKVFVSFAQSMRYFPENKTVLTGNPIRKEIFKHKMRDGKYETQDGNLPLIYITGGNQGARVLNQAVIEALPQLTKRYRIIHQCGKLDYLRVKSQALSLKSNLRKHYLLTDYVGLENIGWVLNRTDLVISRAGANIVYELAALGKPAILIPIPWAHRNEQLENASLLADVGLAEVLRQSELSSTSLCEKIKTVMTELKIYKNAASKARKLVIANAAQKLVDEIENET